MNFQHTTLRKDITVGGPADMHFLFCVHSFWTFILGFTYILKEQSTLLHLVGQTCTFLHFFCIVRARRTCSYRKYNKYNVIS